MGTRPPGPVPACTVSWEWTVRPSGQTGGIPTAPGSNGVLGSLHGHAYQSRGHPWPVRHVTRPQLAIHRTGSLWVTRECQPQWAAQRSVRSADHHGWTGDTRPQPYWTQWGLFWYYPCCLWSSCLLVTIFCSLFLDVVPASVLVL